MMILHAGLTGGRLLLWAETPAAEKPAAKGRGRPSKSSTAQPLPFAARPEVLTAVLQANLPGWKELQGANESAFLWLPTVEGRPVPSITLIAELPTDAGAAVLTPWQVAALALTQEQALDLLAACLDQTT